MELKFKGGAEIVRLIIDRQKKKLKFASSRTDYKIVELPWFYLFDKRKEKAQDKITERLNDEEFKYVIVLAMRQRGYIEDGEC